MRGWGREKKRAGPCISLDTCRSQTLALFCLFSLFLSVAAGGALPPGLWEEVTAALAATEAASGKKFGLAGVPDPLLLSVRSGAALSMPGMMDTVLNLGLNDEIVAAMESAAAGDEAKIRWIRDCHRRLLDMYGCVSRAWVCAGAGRGKTLRSSLSFFSLSLHTGPSSSASITPPLKPRFKL